MSVRVCVCVCTVGWCMHSWLLSSVWKRPCVFPCLRWHDPVSGGHLGVCLYHGDICMVVGLIVMVVA